MTFIRSGNLISCSSTSVSGYPLQDGRFWPVAFRLTWDDRPSKPKNPAGTSKEPLQGQSIPPRNVYLTVTFMAPVRSLVPANSTLPSPLKRGPVVMSRTNRDVFSAVKFLARARYVSARMPRASIPVVPAIEPSS
jgi:hypothetical protein